MKTDKPTIFRICFILLWLGLFAWLLGRDLLIEQVEVKEAQILARSKEESYLGVYFTGQRIGYVQNRLSPNDNGFTLNQKAHLNIKVLGEVQPIKMSLVAQLDVYLHLIDFSFSFSSPFYKMNATGKAAGRRIDFTLHTGKDTITDSLLLSKPAMLATNQRAYLLKEGLEKGDKFKIPFFDPFSLSGQDSTLEYKGEEKILLKGRVHLLHHFVESVSGIRVNSWLDNNGRVIKEESPAGFVFLAEPKFQALAIGETKSDLLKSVAVPLTGKMPDLVSAKALRLKISLPKDNGFELSGGRQDYLDNVLTITKERLPETTINQCRNQPQWLVASPYIQTKHQDIVALSTSLTSTNTNQLAQVKQIANWIEQNIEKRPVVGIPDAVTTLHNKKGDCNEHAALFTALARSIGIPTKIAAGLVFMQGSFYYHAWNEVCLDENWYSIDTTTNQFPTDVSHVKFIEGETKEMLAIGGLINNLSIEVVETSTREP